jgi:hypothetical protein
LQNKHLDERTARDIDSKVRKVLRDLGNPKPPLRLEYVRDVLELDRAYYSSTDDGVLHETVHRLKMAGKQVIRRPRLLLEVVKKLELKALWVPDRNRILIDAELPSAKQRWGEAHEIGHSLLPWHEGGFCRGQTRDSGFKSKAFSIDATFLATSRFDSAKRFPRVIRSDALSGWLNPNRPDNSRSVAVVQRRHSIAATSRPPALLR